MYRSNNSDSSRGPRRPKGSFNPNRHRGSAGRGGGGGRRFGGGGRGRRGGGGGRRMGSFNPTMLIRNTVFEPNPEKLEYSVKHKFNDFEINDQLKKNIADRGYITPTPIQDQLIPYILEGRDAVGLASTGTGKTAAFLIPLINKIMSNPKDNPGRVLIMAPTRELALQIDSEFKLFSKGTQLYSSLCIGGASIHRQIESFKRRPEFIIGTPGRLIDLEKRRKLNFNKFTAIVLDEVDQMLDMGFINDIRYVVDLLPQERHAMFFSATMPSKINEIIHSFLNNPIKVQIESQKASVNVQQDIIKVSGQSKVDILHDLLIQEGFDKVLVFGRTKHGLDKLSKNLYNRGFKVIAIHGNKSQGQRQRALKQFRGNQVQILLATDIASRGLDIDDVTHVINYDLPQTQEDYIHRIGRTGRANKTGIALTFVD